MPLFLASGGLTALPTLLPAVLPRPSAVRVAFLAAAAELEPDPWWVQRDREVLRSFGWEVADLDPDVGEARLSEALSAADLVFAAGGNTYRLLHRLRSTGLDHLLTEFVQRGGLYAGSSAGAIVAGPDIELTAEPDQRPAVPELTWTEGLGWVPFGVLPHAGRRTPRFVAHHNVVLQRGLEAPVVRITDDEAVVVDDDGWRLLWSPATQSSSTSATSGSSSTAAHQAKWPSPPSAS